MLTLPSPASVIDRVFWGALFPLSGSMLQVRASPSFHSSLPTRRLPRPEHPKTGTAFHGGKPSRKLLPRFLNTRDAVVESRIASYGRTIKTWFAHLFPAYLVPRIVLLPQSRESSCLVSKCRPARKRSEGLTRLAKLPSTVPSTVTWTSHCHHCHHRHVGWNTPIVPLIQ
jgi:hypothetical protein